MPKFIVGKEKELKGLSQKLIEKYRQQRIFAFSGELGTGKTTFIKYICDVLGVRDLVRSPTFTIMNQYSGPDGSAIYHFDFYRIKNIREVYDLGYEEFFYSGNYCFIEWAEHINELLPNGTIRIEMDIKENKREIVIRK
jgi:tRNA threonylcarbamoyladenosine biosynthesis protein TsaE